jgi:hypothetical protein
MRYPVLLLAILLSAPAVLAQDNDYANWEYYIGYAHERANNGADRLDVRGRAVRPNGTTVPVDFVSERVPYNGVIGELIANVHRRVGLVADFSATFARVNLTDRLSGQTFSARLARYTLLGGPRFNWRNSSRLVPFAHALFGVTRFSADFRDNNFTCPDTTETAFAMALGAGLDVRGSEHFDVRAIQVDYLPVYFSRKREDNLRFSAGIKIK